MGSTAVSWSGLKKIAKNFCGFFTSRGSGNLGLVRNLSRSYRTHFQIGLSRQRGRNRDLWEDTVVFWGVGSVGLTITFSANGVTSKAFSILSGYLKVTGKSRCSLNGAEDDACVAEMGRFTTQPSLESWKNRLLILDTRGDESGFGAIFLWAEAILSPNVSWQAEILRQLGLNCMRT